ncbi:hypothetical protein Dsin_007467 [Dipteronia sinensis]|uniref:Reverse transcriptase domain-containing protein n=1 Tax=Dipteronia sinensis TaxID=43782 RepID=A0AAE0EIG0_9ROSI|nr:hypothetical protein Dsin_007467 [Dipteronia sinensis]
MPFQKKNRQITDSFVIAEEIIHKWKNETEGGLLLKLDFEKAYDSVDHNFLDFMMEGMGFGYKWREWMKECTSTPLVSVLVNGRATDQFKLEKGLRQGDPLSPFLFNIVVEGLNCLLKKTASIGLIEGERFEDDKVHITHLQFADDTIFFIKPRMDHLLNAKRILRCFELVSGLKIKFHKSGLARIGIGKTEESVFLAAAFKCRTMALPITYLGFLLGGKPGSKVFWNSLVDKIERRLAPWKRKFLSKGGRLVLIKAVISSLPTYFLSVFKIPVGIALRIEKLQRDFLWGNGVLKRKIHAVSWAEVCRSKANGGLGIERMLDKSKAMLAKWIWRFGREDEALWRKVLCSKYRKPVGSLFWNWNGTKKVSFFIKSVESLLKEGSSSARLIKEGFLTMVGKGDRIDFWNDLKVEGKSLKESFPRCFALAEAKDGLLKNFGVWRGQKWEWNILTRRPPFDWEKDQWHLFTTFLKCITIRRHFSDSIAWSANSKGLFSVGSFRRALENTGVNGMAAPTFLWKGICPPKIELFLWQLWRGKVLVRAVLYRHGMEHLSNLECPLCNKEIETTDHLFLHCTWSYSLWQKCMAWWDVEGCHTSTVSDWLEYWMGMCPAFKSERVWCSLFYAIVWTIWEARNLLVFERKVPNVEQAADLVKFRIIWWFKHLGRGSQDMDKSKFNVDGSVRGKPGPAGIGGVLRDSNGKVWCLFSKFVGVTDSNTVELWAIKKAVQLCSENPELRGREVEVVSDSKVAVSWVNDKDFGSLAHVNAIYNIRYCCSSFGNLEVTYDSRAFNSFADSLAKMGSSMVGDFVVWGDL